MYALLKLWPTTHARHVTYKEAPLGVEPRMTDLQSVALASWLRRHFARILMAGRDLRQVTLLPPVSHLRQELLLSGSTNSAVGLNQLFRRFQLEQLLKVTSQIDDCRQKTTLGWRLAGGFGGRLRLGSHTLGSNPPGGALKIAHPRPTGGVAGTGSIPPGCAFSLFCLGLSPEFRGTDALGTFAGTQAESMAFCPQTRTRRRRRRSACPRKRPTLSKKPKRS